MTLHELESLCVVSVSRGMTGRRDCNRRQKDAGKESAKAEQSRGNRLILSNAGS